MKKDNVAVAPMNIPADKELDSGIVSKEIIPFGHKIALSNIKKNDFVFKYGQIIGVASKDILPGEHVHSHNLEFSEFERNFEKLDNNKKKINNLDNLFFRWL